METKEVEILLQRYFDGETSLEEEKILEEYFASEEVPDEFQSYKGLFAGLGELSESRHEADMGNEIMDYILEQEFTQKNRYRGMWQMVTGIAAAIILVLGGLLIYEQQRPAFKDTYSSPEEAYAQAQKTLHYISAKYNTGLSQLSKTRKVNAAFAELKKVEVLNRAPKPLSKGLKAVRAGFDETKKITEIKTN
jgi:hypothetical protein